MRLAELHWSSGVGDRVSIRVSTDPSRGAPTLAELVTGAGFVVDGCSSRRVDATRALSLPDTVGPRMRVLVCGLNPSVYAAERGVGFARASNRFWKAAVAAGLLGEDAVRDPRLALSRYGVGMTDLAKRATVASSELARDEYIAGAGRVAGIARWMRPRLVMFVGLEGWRAALDPRGVAGFQTTQTFGACPAYVMPSTSGLNASASFDDLVAHFRAVVSFVESRAG